MDLDGYKECLEFEARLLEAKQWKTRSFVARLRNDGSGIPQLNVYKKGKLKKTINFYDYYGMESGTLIDGEVLTLSVICLSDTSVIAFSDESNLLGFENWLRSYLGYGCSFHCYVLFAPSRSGLQAEQYVRLHLQDNRFCLVAGIPGSLVLKFFTSDVQCYGAVRNKFCFQVKSTCTSAPYGTYVLRSSHCGKMDAYFCLASRMQLNYFLLQRAMNCSYGKENTSEPEPPLLSDDRQSEDCLNELLSPYGSPMAARNGSFSYRLLEQELPFDHQKLRVKSSSSLNNETNDMTCERSCSLIRMYSDSQLGSPPLKMCHRCFQHKYINQSFVDSLEFYDNCKFARSDRVNSKTVS